MLFIPTQNTKPYTGPLTLIYRYRLPGLYGTNLSKNYIFDLLTASEYLFKIDLSTCHQWYNLGLLRGDIDHLASHIDTEVITSLTSLSLYHTPPREVTRFSVQ